MPTSQLRKYFISASNEIDNGMRSLLSGENDEFSHFARNMHAFIHERIDALFILIQTGCLWDADMILRSVAEASIKLIFVSIQLADERNNKALEFWVDIAEINQIKQAKQAEAVVENLKDTDFNPLHIEPITMSKNDLDRLTKKWPRNKRQRILQSWSYNEMVKQIAAKTDNKTIESLARNFTQSSHLIHADETALGVINDRKNRTPEEKNALIILHERRLLSDCITLYSYPLRILAKDVYKKTIDGSFETTILKFNESASLLEKYQEFITP